MTTPTEAYEIIEAAIDFYAKAYSVVVTYANYPESRSHDVFEDDGQRAKEALALLPALKPPAEQPDEFTLLGVIADIRQKTGVGDKPMLSELANVLAGMIQGRDKTSRVQAVAAAIHDAAVINQNSGLAFLDNPEACASAAIEAMCADHFPDATKMVQQPAPVGEVDEAARIIYEWKKLETSNMEVLSYDELSESLKDTLRALAKRIQALTPSHSDTIAVLKQAREAIKTCKYTKVSWHNGSSESFNFDWRKMENAEAAIDNLMKRLGEV
ncbi:hypothetical protein R5W24_000545 [Gemmata sp. JC717]|uniref:hypothetical protein n=1 Tax=Gemmata algarum TaxID=2975278 RepID=UPI0021BAA6DA|nr:hypothetical protein [Gemmata algarum]MDY3551469.1 hypothetical protein [Gemmata algarum]